ncbi:alpha-L RNA-binding motif-containing protein [Abortiporus biennis]|nr:alpha-L RNA-binding motif-containing protein [Abortiporus biennis]
MRDVHVYSFKRALPRMSWHPRNLYNLWRRSVGELVQKTTFTHLPPTLFQQRWKAKALLRGYHGDYINEKIFKRWYLPETLPDVRPHRKVAEAISLNKWAKRNDPASSEERRKREEEVKGLAPVGSLMFSEVERRIDVVIFRACLAHSVYEARRLVIHGDVLLNGKKHQNANTRLAPGDMVSVDPKAIRFLQPKPVEAEAEKTDGEDTPPVSEEKKSPEYVQSKFSSEKETPPLTPFNLPPYASPFLFVPAYLEPSFSTCSVIYLRHPTARPGYSEIPTPWDADGELVRLAWEWYSKVRPRMRSKKQLARMPENRQ